MLDIIVLLDLFSHCHVPLEQLNQALVEVQFMIVPCQPLELKLQHGETRMLLEMLVKPDIIAQLVHLGNHSHVLLEPIQMLLMLLILLVVSHALKVLLVKKGLVVQLKLSLSEQQATTALLVQLMHISFHALLEHTQQIQTIFNQVIVHHVLLDIIA
jgi:hypothetical protein